MKNRRKYPRISVSFPVECKTLPARNYFYTVSKDLSLTGAKIVSNDFLPKNNLLKLNINLINTVIDLKAKVSWCNKERIADRYSTGLEFMEIGTEQKEDLSDFLNKITAS